MQMRMPGLRILLASLMEALMRAAMLGDCEERTTAKLQVPAPASSGLHSANRKAQGRHVGAFLWAHGHRGGIGDCGVFHGKGVSWDKIGS